MFDNHLYNLLTQLAEEHKSLWRIINMYKKDAEGCPKCQELWEKLEKNKEEHIKLLTEVLKEHLQ